METNREHYKNEILDIVLNGHKFAFNKATREPCACELTCCSDCLFTTKESCNQKIKEWATRAYQPPVDASEWIKVYNQKFNADPYTRAAWFKRGEICVIVDKDGETGIARRYYTDKHNREKAIAIAYARYLRVEIPHEVIEYETN